jgi:hypothetical protein
MNFAVRGALLCALAVWTMGAFRPSDVPQLVSRMRAASGPIWRVHLSSVSKLTIDGEEAVIAKDAQEQSFTTRQCSGALCAGTYFDGRHLFSVDINGTALPHSRAVEVGLRAVRTVSSLAFLDPAFTRNGGRIDSASDATINGKRYHSFVVSDPDATPMRVYVDPSSYLVAFARDINGDTTLEFRNYRRVDGAYMLPFLVLNNGTQLEAFSSRHASNDPFVAPHGLVPTIAGTPIVTETDPDRTTPVFPCTLSGSSVRCLLDTGNSGIAISSELAEALHLHSIGQLQVRGLGNYATQVVRTGPLAIGNVSYPQADYVVLSDIHRFGYDVVLGADILAQSLVEIDPIAHHISFQGRAPENSAVTVPLAFENFVPVVNVQLGTVDAQLAVDTGDESNINLSYDFYKEHQDLFNATEQRTVSGVGGTSVEVMGKIPLVKIGDLSIGEQRIGATQTLHGTAYGHLGAAFFSHFRVVLDYANGELHLDPDTTKAPRL